jgi:hypothetical protein
MSDKWETVTKANTGARKPQANGRASNGTGGVRPAKPQAKVYTVEDVLPAASVVNGFANAFDPQPKSPKKDANGAAKPKPKPQAAKVEKPRVPATVAEAVKERVRVEDLKTLLDEVQQRWPDSPLLWLRDVAGYLNHSLVTQPEAAVEVLGGEPATALTISMRKVIGAMLQRCEESMRETFFETCVANTAHDLAKGTLGTHNPPDPPPLLRSVRGGLALPDAAARGPAADRRDGPPAALCRAQEQLPEPAGGRPRHPLVRRAGRAQEPPLRGQG